MDRHQVLCRENYLTMSAGMAAFMAGHSSLLAMALWPGAMPAEARCQAERGINLMPGVVKSYNPMPKGCS